MIGAENVTARPGPGNITMPGLRNAGTGILVWIIALIAAAPVLVAFFSVFAQTGDVWPHLMRHVLPEAFLNTLLLVLGVALMTAVIGVSLAWLVAVCDFPGRRFFRWGLLLPMAMPGYVLGFAFAAIFEYTGPVQSWWRDTLGAQSPFPALGSGAAAMVTLSLVLYPYVFLLVQQAFRSQGLRGLEVAQSCGLGPTRGFFSVSLPMARPFIVAGVSLAVMECLADFGTVQLFNYTTFTTAIYRSWYGLFSLQSALQLSLVLITLVLVSLMLERRLRGRARYTSPGVSAKQRHIQLQGIRRYAATLYCTIVFLVAFAAPAALIVKWSLQKFAVEFDDRYWQLAQNSLTLSFFAAMLITAFALLLSLTVRRTPTPMNRAMSRIATLGYAVPGTVLAVGFFVPVAWLSRQLNSVLANDGETVVALQGGLLVIFLAYASRYLAVAHNSVDSALQRIKPGIEDASLSLGVSGWQMFRRIHAPILRPAIVTAALLVFVDVMKELPITLMTRPFGWDTLAVRVFQLTTEGEWQRAALPALAIVIAGLIPVILLSQRQSHA